MQPDKIISLPILAPEAPYLAALPMAALILSSDRRVRFLNAAGEEMLGLSAVHAIGQRFDELFHPGAALPGLVERVFTEQQALREYEHALRPLRGMAQPVNLLLVPVRSEVVVLCDATAAMQALAGQAAQRGVVRAAGTIAAMLAHEVKNPLAGIKGAAQLLGEDRSSDERALADLICREVERVRQLLDQFEFLSDAPEQAIGSTNVHAALDDACVLAQSGAGQRIAVDKNYDPSLPPVLARRDALVQLFLNLLKNAAEAIECINAPRLVLTTSYKGGLRTRRADGEVARAFICVMVEDNGPGIPEALRETLFEPFVSTKEGSRGLGLAIACKIVADCGGTLELESSQPGCTRFRVMLPCEA